MPNNYSRIKKLSIIGLIVLLILSLTIIQKSTDVSAISPKTTTGIAKVHVMEDLTGIESKTIYKIQSQNAEYFLNFPKEYTIPKITSGELLQVTGFANNVASDSEIEVQTIRVIPKSIASSNIENLGEQKTAVILVKFPEDNGEQKTKEEVNNLIFDTSNEYSTNNFIKETSYGKASLVGEVYGWYTLNITKQQFVSKDPLGSLDFLTKEAIKASDSEIDLTQYERLIIVFPFIDYNSYRYSGFATIGKWYFFIQDQTPLRLSSSLINGPENIKNLAPHELGHNFNLFHANDWECGESPFKPSLKGCYNLEYADAFDIMGNNNYLSHYSANNKKTIGWLNENQIVKANDEGIYSLTPLETENGVKTIEISTLNTNYSIEFRRPIGFDRKISNSYGREIYNGVFIREINNFNYGSTHLIDSSPHLNSTLNQITDSIFSVLKVEEIFSDPTNDLYLKVLSVNDEEAKIIYTKTQTICGNSILELSEKCDDENTNNGDGCSSTCQIEEDYSCHGEPSICSALCIDTDNGINSIIRGKTYLATNPKSYEEDICLPNDNLMEWFCSYDPISKENIVTNQIIACSICSNGSCVINQRSPLEQLSETDRIKDYITKPRI